MRERGDRGWELRARDAYVERRSALPGAARADVRLLDVAAECGYQREHPLGCRLDGVRSDAEVERRGPFQLPCGGSGGGCARNGACRTAGIARALGGDCRICMCLRALDG